MWLNNIKSWGCLKDRYIWNKKKMFCGPASVIDCSVLLNVCFYKLHKTVIEAIQRNCF